MSDSIELTPVQLSYFKNKSMKKITDEVLELAEDIGLRGGGPRDFYRHNVQTQAAMKALGEDEDAQPAMNKAACVPEDLDFFAYSEETYNKVKKFLEEKYSSEFKRHPSKYAATLLVETVKIPLLLFDSSHKISIDLIRCVQPWDGNVDVDFDVNSLIQTKTRLFIFNSHHYPKHPNVLDEMIEMSKVLKAIESTIMTVQPLSDLDYKDPRKISKVTDRCESMLERGWTVRSIKGKMYTKADTHTQCPCGKHAVTKSDQDELFCHQCFDLFDQIPQLDKPDQCPICMLDLEGVERPLSCGHWCHRVCQVAWGLECTICRQAVRMSFDEKSQAQDKQYRRRHDRHIELAADPDAV
jgi:hypothetical protein